MSLLDTHNGNVRCYRTIRYQIRIMIPYKLPPQSLPSETYISVHALILGWREHNNSRIHIEVFIVAQESNRKKEKSSNIADPILFSAEAAYHRGRGHGAFQLLRGVIHSMSCSKVRIVHTLPLGWLVEQLSGRASAVKARIFREDRDECVQLSFLRYAMDTVRKAETAKPGQILGL
jgi:hypothetical protein